MAEAKKTLDPQKEIEILVGELEERVDRLRALYEQYFMGYEKLEPSVPRKDVDRRFVQLRKSQIRNTALRFRFNVVTQKFNTYSMYWTRVCRQIEEGTFKRHIQRANKRFGPKGLARDQEFSIDVELGDFEVEIDDTEASRVFDPSAAPTVPPTAAPTAPPSAATAPPPAPKSMPKPQPHMQMRARAPSIVDEEANDTIPPASSAGSVHQRAARHAVLPAGAKQRVLVKKGAPSAPGAGPTVAPPSSEPAAATMARRTEPVPPSKAELTPAPTTAPSGGVRGRMPSVPDRAPPSTSVIRAASSQGHVHRSPAGLVRPAISPNAQSVQRVPVAKPAASDTAPPPPSIGRIPGAANVPGAASAAGAQSVGRVPVPAGAQPPPSVGRVPVPAGSSPNPAVRAPAPSVPSFGRMPIGLPSGGSVGRTPISATIPPPAPAATTPAAQNRPVPAPPPSERRLPIPPPSQRSPVARPGGPMPAAPAIRPPSPSVPDMEKSPPSRRPPPMLPSQVKKS